MPFFSIIIPTYNRAHMLPKALDSVHEQIFSNWECIVVDDGSTDDTRQVVEDWVKKDSRFRYIYQENAERSAARNNGILNAKGRYICFLDSDDQYLPNHLETIYQSIVRKKEPVAMFFTGMTIDRNGVREIVKSNKNNYFNFSTYFFKEAITPSRVCISKEILDYYKFDESVIISEDSKLYVSISNAGYKTYMIDANTVVFYIHEDNTVNVSKRNVYKSRQITLKQILKDDTGRIIDRKVAKQTINDCFWGMKDYYIANNQYVKAFFTLLKALFLNPFYRTKEKSFALLQIIKKGVAK